MQLITTLLTIIGSGIAAAAMTYVLNARREQVFFMRKKAEELYVSFDRFEKMISENAMRGVMLINGNITREQYTEMSLKEEPPEVRDAHQNMLMLISIYFTPCRANYETFYKERGKVMGMILGYKSSENSPAGSRMDYSIKYDQVIDSYGLSADNLRAVIVEQAQTLASEDALWPAVFRWSVAKARVSHSVGSVQTRLRDRIARARAAGRDE